MSRGRSGITLIELMIAIVLLSIIVLAINQIDIFSNVHAISAARLVRINNEVWVALEHLGKNVLQGVGNVSQPPLEQIANGFRVRIDSRQTPQDLNDDLWFNYSLNANTLSCACTQVSAASPVCPPGETLSKYIISGVVFGLMPSNPTNGFYINLTENNTLAEIGLVARYFPVNATDTTNPQIEMKSKFYTHSSAAR